MRDTYGRTIDYMRISITDRCNLSCRYCIPDASYAAPADDFLTYENICEIVRAAVDLGITKYKITGGEPLVRKDCPTLVGMIKAIPGVSQVTMTTNGILLADSMDALLANGLDAVNISLDTLRSERFKQITGRDSFDTVMDGLNAAVKAATVKTENNSLQNGSVPEKYGISANGRDSQPEGFRVKINTVLQRGINEDEWEELVLLAKDMPVDVRFIELMPIGAARKYDPVGNDHIFSELCKKYPKQKKDEAVHGNGPAVYVKIPGFTGTVGFISALHGKFCGRCNRIRLTARGRLRPCLCFGDEVDLRPVFFEKDQAIQAERIAEALTKGILGKPREHSFETPHGAADEGGMVSIGG